VPGRVLDTTFAWTDAGWRGVPSTDTVLYELHVGTFTPRGPSTPPSRSADLPSSASPPSS
jgi:1,4-alpha-glucan branching enzyme